MLSTSWITMLSCEVRRQDKEDRLRQELQKFQSGQNVKLNAKTRLKFYQFLKPEGKFNIKGFISFASVSGLLHSRFYKKGKTENRCIQKKMYAIFGKEFFKSLFIWSIYESRVYFLSFIEVYEGPRVKDQTPSQIQEMLEGIYDRMQYFWWEPD